MPNRACSGHNSCLSLPGTTYSTQVEMNNDGTVTVTVKTTAAWLTSNLTFCVTALEVLAVLKFSEFVVK